MNAKVEIPAMTLDEAKRVVAGKTAPRVTEESIVGRMGSVEYTTHGQMTVCFITMKNGFRVVGVSAPASPDNFDADVGKRYAYDNAFKQLWPLEGYLLREKLSEIEARTPEPKGETAPAKRKGRK